MLVYKQHNDIDKTKWDECITNSINSLPYAYSWYLNLVCDNWDAIVLNDYQAVMPLPWKSKFGFRYISHPYFCQQLGVFYTTQTINVDDFIKAIPKSFLFVRMNLNFSNTDSKFVVKTNSNYTIELSEVDHKSQYSKSHLNNIQKAIKKGVSISLNPDNSEDYSAQKANESSSFMTDNLLKLERKIINHLIDLKKGKIFSASLNAENCSSIFLYQENNRLILLTSYTNREGKKNGAYFYLLDHILNMDQFRNFIFDFEGSNLVGVAKRNRGFGAVKTTYDTIQSFFWDRF